MRSPPAPQIAGRPMPRATTAACEAEPPLTVRMPVAAIIPGRSPGVVSLMTSRTDSPASVISTAVSLVSAIRPTAAPGEAPSPDTRGTSTPVSFGCGCSSSSTWVGAVLRTASVSSVIPRMARSTARLVATRALGRRSCSRPTSASPSGPYSKSTVTALRSRPSSSASTPVSISTPSGRLPSGWPVSWRSPLQRKPWRKAPFGANWPVSMSREEAKPWPSSSCSVTTTVSRCRASGRSGGRFCFLRARAARGEFQRSIMALAPAATCSDRLVGNGAEPFSSHRSLNGSTRSTGSG